jgi:hypothetical protein
VAATTDASGNVLFTQLLQPRSVGDAGNAWCVVRMVARGSEPRVPSSGQGFARTAVAGPGIVRKDATPAAGPRRSGSPGRTARRDGVDDDDDGDDERDSSDDDDDDDDDSEIGRLLATPTTGRLCVA